MRRFLKRMYPLLLILMMLLPVTAAFAQEHSFAELLTEEEKNYIVQADCITVIFSPNKGPIQYADANGTQKGISLDMLHQISAVSGLEFEYVPLSGMQNIKDAIDQGEAQILAGIPVEQTVKDTYAVDFSQPYIECTYGVLLNRGGSIDHPENLTLALTAGLDIPENFRTVKSIRRYDTIQECIAAVSRKEADFTYGNSYVLEFYSQGYKLQNLCIVPFAGSTQQICFGVSQQADPLLCSILDKSITYVGLDGILNFVVKNVAASTQPFTIASAISLNPRLSIIVSLLVLLLIVVLCASLVVNNRRKGALIRLEHQHHLLLSEAAREYFYEYNFQTDTLELNADTAELFGSQLIYKKWRSLLHHNTLLQKSDIAMLEQLYDVPRAPEENNRHVSKSMELILPLPNDKKHWFRITRIILFHSGKPAYSIGKLVDIEEEHQTYDELMKKSVSDSLTGIYNTMAAKEFITHSLKNVRSGVMFIFDLDYFKQINDRFGHQTGDRVILEFTEILKRTFRENDIIARVGGDEFLVFAKNTSDTAFIENKCLALQKQVRNIDLDGDYVQTISIGIAKLAPDSTYEKLFQQADAALYYVKEHGRAGYHIFEE